MSYHGTLNGYSNIRCRCDLCREAGAIENRKQKTRRLANRVVVDGVLIHPFACHGTETGYRNWGCRCDLCTEAASVASRKRRHLNIAT